MAKGVVAICVCALVLSITYADASAAPDPPQLEGRYHLPTRVELYSFYLNEFGSLVICWPSNFGGPACFIRAREPMDQELYLTDGYHFRWTGLGSQWIDVYRPD